MLLHEKKKEKTTVLCNLFFFFFFLSKHGTNFYAWGLMNVVCRKFKDSEKGQLVMTIEFLGENSSLKYNEIYSLIFK